MKLSARQIALFDQVRVDMAGINALPTYTTLFKLYEEGWWVTERFGTLVTIVKPRKWNKDGFACLQRRIITSINLDSLDEETKKIADRKFEKYKQWLLEKRRYTRIRVKPDEINMPTLPQRD